MLLEKIGRISGSLEFWGDISLPPDRNFTTQKGLIHGILRLKSDFDLRCEPEHLLLHSCPTETFDFRVRLDHTQEVFEKIYRFGHPGGSRIWDHKYDIS